MEKYALKYSTNT